MVSAEGRRSSARKASASSSKGAPSVTSTAAASSTKENSVPSSSGSKPSLQAKKGTNEGLNSNKRNWFDNASDRGSVVSTPKKGPSEDLEDLTV